VSIADAILHQRQRIAAAASRAGRSASDVRLVAVSKFHDLGAIEEAVAAGQVDFGESYVQEWQPKAAALGARARWHFIGHLQSNKAKPLAGAVALIHGVDRESVVRALAGVRLVPQDLLIQVNISGEVSKSGCTPTEAAELVALATTLPGLRPVGLMTMAPANGDLDDARATFRGLRALRDSLRATLAERDPALAASFTELSMGMSDDLEVAVEEGATLVRVGTAIFGARA
jgi:pyridoxal phosphate enzyme (YggS family)